MEGIPETGIVLDWKAVGRDFLSAFPEAYPALDCLRSPAFAALQAQCANASPEDCFEVLSGFLRTRGHQLWSVDTGGDSHWIHVVADDGVDAFLEAHAGAGAFGNGCERLAPGAPSWKAPKVPKKKPEPLVEATDWHRQYGSVFPARGGVRYGVVPFEDENGEFQLLVDLDTFPPAEIEATGFHAMLDQGHRFFPLHDTPEGQYWEWQPARERRGTQKLRPRLVRIVDYRTPVLEEVAGSEGGALEFGDRAGHGNRVYLVRALRAEAAWFDPSARMLDSPAPADGDAGPWQGLLCLEDLRLKHLASLCRGEEVQVMLLAEDRLLVLRRQVRTEAGAAVDYFLLDPRDASVLARGRLPHVAETIGHSTLPLEALGLLYVREETRPHPTHEHVKEKTGWLVQLDLHGRRWREAKLDGLCNDWTENMACLRGHAQDRHRIRSFEGHVHFTSGHDGVVVLNYLTNYPGKHDAAWLWDRHDDSVTILRPSDFAGGTPTLRYLPAMQRYVADDSCRLDLLVAYERIRATRPRTALNWGAWQPLP